MYNVETLQTLLTHFNEDCEDVGETKESIALVIENLLTFYLERNPPKKDPTELLEKQIIIENKFMSVSEFMLLFDEDIRPVFGKNFIYIKAKAQLAFNKDTYSEIFSKSHNHSYDILLFNPVKLINHLVCSSRTHMKLREKIKFYIDEGYIFLQDEKQKAGENVGVILKTLTDGTIDGSLNILDEWSLMSSIEEKCPFVNYYTLFGLKRRIRKFHPDQFDACFGYKEVNRELGISVNLFQLFKFILKNRLFAPKYYGRLKTLIQDKLICLS